MVQNNPDVWSTQTRRQARRPMMRRSARVGVWALAIALVALAALSAFEVVATDTNLVLDAHELPVAERLSWFDALIVEAAIRSRCDVLYSEDLAHGRRFGALTVCNPLAEAEDARS